MTDFLDNIKKGQREFFCRLLAMKVNLLLSYNWLRFYPFSYPQMLIVSGFPADLLSFTQHRENLFLGQEAQK